MKLKEDDINKILELRKKGFKIKDIAEIFGVSPRRIQQILKNPSLKKPGRKRIELSPELRGEIIQLREKGYTINQIHQILESRRYSISRYKIWRTIKEQRETEILKIMEELISLSNKHDPTIFLGVLPVSCGNSNLLKLLLISDVSKSKVIYYNLFKSLTLRDVIDAFDFHVLRVQIPELVILFSTPPLVPTRSSENRLTRHLKNLGIPYIWMPEPLKEKCKERIERIQKLFMEKYHHSHYMVKQTEKICKEILEAHQYGNTEQDKEIFKEQNCRGDKKL